MGVLEVASEAITRARRGSGPTLIEAKTYRHKGHSRLDTGERYRPAEEVERWLAQDPLPRAAALLPEEMADRIRQEAEAEMSAVLEAAQSAPWPDAERERGVSPTKEPV
jgi:pyruvate dehydrogenase E1 component alpha subunit